MVAEHFNKPSETKAHTTTIIPGPCPLPTNPPTLAPCAVPANHTAPAPFAVPDNPTALATYAVPARPAPVGTMFTLKSLIPLTSTPETILKSPTLLHIGKSKSEQLLYSNKDRFTKIKSPQAH